MWNRDDQLSQNLARSIRKERRLTKQPEFFEEREGMHPLVDSLCVLSLAPLALPLAASLARSLAASRSCTCFHPFFFFSH
jgi:hypothetical protein